jgi:hypothetical protein
MAITWDFRHRPDREFQWEVYCDPQKVDVYRWCWHTFGNPDTERRWQSHGGWIKLLNDQDKSWFLLKWL